jgi:hypothetical protein
MRYQELYEMIDMGMLRASVNFPISDNLKQFLITQAVNKIGETVVLKKKTISPSVVSTTAILDADDMTSKIYKVEAGDKNLPFISEETTNPNTATTTITNNAWYVKQDRQLTGELTNLSVTDVDPSLCEFENPAHGLEIGNRILISEMTDIVKPGVKHPINGQIWRVVGGDDELVEFYAKTNVHANEGYSGPLAASGIWEDRTYKIHFLKAPEGTVKVYYYAKPTPMDSLASEVDLPSELISAVVHLIIARLLSTDGQMQMGSGHRGIAKQIIEEWIQARSRREQYPDIVPPPMTNFIDK